VAEVRQLVFHVVVAPQRAPFHAAMFKALVDVPPRPWVATRLPLGFATAGGSLPLPPEEPRGHELMLGAAFLPPLLLTLGAAAGLWHSRKQRQRPRSEVPIRRDAC
jgi:hypothetical protein